MEKREVKEADIKLAVQYFNMVTNKSFGYGKRNTELISSALEIADLSEVRRSMKDWAANDSTRTDYALEKFVSEFVDSKRLDEKIHSTKDFLDGKETSVSESIDLLGKVVVDMIAKASIGDIRASVADKLHEDCKKFIFDNYGPIQRKIELQVGDRKAELKGVLHSEFETVLQFVSADVPVFLAGPAGSGKNVICKQVAEALGLDFYFSNAVTQEYKITGFTDAMGHFQESQFYKAFKNGGVFMLDEMDASIPEVLVILNAAIANRYFDFPAPIGYVEAHPDDEVLGAGGFIRKSVDAGDEVDVVILNADYEKTRKGMMDDLLKSHDIIGVKNRVLCSYVNMNFFREDQRSMVETIEAEIERFEPDYIFTHFPDDIHSDHKITSIVTQQAARLWQRHCNGHKVKGLYFMEVLSSTNWSDASFKPDTYVEISEGDLERKIEALSVYDNVVRPAPHPRSCASIRSLAILRGCNIGYEFAEAFMTCWRDNI